MVEKLIIKSDRYRILSIPLSKYSDEWVVFRVKTARKIGGKIKRSRLSYSRHQRRLAWGHSAKAFFEKDPEGLDQVVELIETAIDRGLV